MKIANNSQPSTTDRIILPHDTAGPSKDSDLQPPL